MELIIARARTSFNGEIAHGGGVYVHQPRDLRGRARGHDRNVRRPRDSSTRKDEGESRRAPGRTLSVRFGRESSSSPQEEWNAERYYPDAEQRLDGLLAERVQNQPGHRQEEQCRYPGVAVDAVRPCRLGLLPSESEQRQGRDRM